MSNKYIFNAFDRHNLDTRNQLNIFLHKNKYVRKGIKQSSFKKMNLKNAVFKIWPILSRYQFNKHNFWYYALKYLTKIDRMATDQRLCKIVRICT